MDVVSTIEFKIGDEAADLIRQEIREQLGSGKYEGVGDEIANVPIFVLVALRGDRAIIGIEKRLAEKPIEKIPKLQPVSLVSAAIFLGDGSCLAEAVVGPYNRWLSC